MKIIEKDDIFNSLSLKDPRQKEQIFNQLGAHQHTNYQTNVLIHPDLTLEGFHVFENVMRPEIMTSLYYARFLYQNREIFHNKTVIDMGCGSGILGIVMCLAGAKKVCFIDIMDEAINNTKKNIEHFNIETSKVEIVNSDLFNNLGTIPNFNKEEIDIIVFAQPYFADNPIVNYPVSKSMIALPEVMERFLKEAKDYFKEQIIMPAFQLTSDANNPLKQADRFNYDCNKLDTVSGDFGLQTGEICFYSLTKKN